MVADSSRLGACQFSQAPSRLFNAIAVPLGEEDHFVVPPTQKHINMVQHVAPEHAQISRVHIW
jgi:hypothetical protein